MGDLSEIGQEF